MAAVRFKGPLNVVDPPGYVNALLYTRFRTGNGDKGVLVLFNNQSPGNFMTLYFGLEYNLEHQLGRSVGEPCKAGLRQTPIKRTPSK